MHARAHHMCRLKGVLEASSDGDNMADGASAGHTCAAHLLSKTTTLATVNLATVTKAVLRTHYAANLITLAALNKVRRAPRGREQAGDEPRRRHSRRDPPRRAACVAAQPQTDAQAQHSFVRKCTAPRRRKYQHPTSGVCPQAEQLQPAAHTVAACSTHTVAGSTTPWTRCSSRWHVASWAAATATASGRAARAYLGLGHTVPSQGVWAIGIRLAFWAAATRRGSKRCGRIHMSIS
jgi:hypothetical protein